MPNTARGDQVVAVLIAAEWELKRRNASRYEGVDLWTDEEIYGSLFGHGGVERAPRADVEPLKRLLRARALLHRARVSADVGAFRNGVYDDVMGNEWHARAIELALAYLGDGALPPDRRPWRDIVPPGMNHH